MLKLKKVTEDSQDLNRLNLLAKEAFPQKEEYLNPKNLLKMQEDGQIIYYAIYDSSLLVGFVVIKNYKNISYLFFFAIEKSLRNKGYGSKTLELLKNMYNKYIHVVDLELVDENAQNNAQRISRRNFYLRNNYFPTKMGLEYFNTKYEILSSKDNFNINDFKELMSQIDLNGFIPQYFKLN